MRTTLLLLAVLFSIPGTGKPAIAQNAYRWVEVGLGKGWLDQNVTPTNISITYGGFGFIRPLYHQIGVNSSSIDYTFAHFDLGAAHSDRTATVYIFLGPSFVTTNVRRQGGNVVSETRTYTAGLNANAGMVLKISRKVGIGVQFFANISDIGNEYGFGVILHRSNGRLESAQ